MTHVVDQYAVLRRLTFLLGVVCAVPAHLPFTQAHSAGHNPTLTASVSQGKGRANGKSLDHLNTKVSAGETASLVSGGART